MGDLIPSKQHLRVLQQLGSYNVAKCVVLLVQCEKASIWHLGVFNYCNFFSPSNNKNDSKAGGAFIFAPVNYNLKHAGSRRKQCSR
uniref:Uncharacterized protein n=1 Tax=Anguilla anguilla TaxID=7936 RepID=A0A0E9WW79_ANGAN